MDIPVILTSAAVGAVVSSIFTFVSQFFERRMRRDELLIKTATDLTTKYSDFALTLVRESHQKASFPPYTWLVHDFHRQLTHLMKYDKLPPKEQKEMEEYRQQVEETRKRNS